MQIPPLTPQAPLTPDSMGQISPQSAAAMVAFQYPPASYDSMTAMPSTPTQPSVSPIVSYQQNMATWSSPPEAMAFEPGADFSSPMVGREAAKGPGCVCHYVAVVVAKRGVGGGVC